MRNAKKAYEKMILEIALLKSCDIVLTSGGEYFEPELPIDPARHLEDEGLLD